MDKLENRNEHQELQRGKNRVSFFSFILAFFSLWLGRVWRAVCGETQCYKDSFSEFMGDTQEDENSVLSEIAQVG